MNDDVVIHGMDVDVVVPLNPELSIIDSDDETGDDQVHINEVCVDEQLKDCDTMDSTETATTSEVVVNESNDCEFKFSHCPVCGFNVEPTLTHYRRILKPPYKNQWLWRYKCRRKLCLKFSGPQYTFRKLDRKMEIYAQDKNLDKLPFLHSIDPTIPESEYGDIVVCPSTTSSVDTERTESMREKDTSRESSMAPLDSQSSGSVSNDSSISRTRCGSPIRNGTASILPLRIRLSPFKKATVISFPVAVTPREVKSVTVVPVDNGSEEVTETDGLLKGEIKNESDSDRPLRIPIVFGDTDVPALEHGYDRMDTVDEKTRTTRSNSKELTVPSSSSRKSANQAKREAELAAQLEMLVEESERPKRRRETTGGKKDESTNLSKQSSVVVLAPPAKKKMKGYAYIEVPMEGGPSTVPIQGLPVTSVQSNTMIVPESIHVDTKKTTQESVRKVNGYTVHESHPSSSFVEQKHLFEEELERLKKEDDGLSPSSSARRFLLCSRALSASNDKNKKLKEQNAQLMQLLSSMKSVVMDTKSSLLVDSRRLRDDVVVVSGEMKHFHRELIHQASTSKNLLDDIKSKVFVKVNDLDRDNRKLKAQITAVTKKMQQCEAQANRYHREVSEKDRLVVLARAQRAEIQKKLDDKLFLANNVKCNHCEKSENVRKHLEKQAQEKASLADTYYKEKMDLGRRLETSERMVQMLMKDNERFKFEMQAHMVDNEKMAKELSTFKASVESGEYVSSHSSTTQRFSNGALTPGDTNSTPGNSRNDSPPDGKSPKDNNHLTKSNEKLAESFAAWVPKRKTINMSSPSPLSTLSPSLSTTVSTRIDPRMKDTKKHQMNKEKDKKKRMKMEKVKHKEKEMKKKEPSTPLIHIHPRDQPIECRTIGMPVNDLPSVSHKSKVFVDGKIPKKIGSSSMDKRNTSSPSQKSIISRSLLDSHPFIQEQKVGEILVKSGPAVPSKVMPPEETPSNSKYDPVMPVKGFARVIAPFIPPPNTTVQKIPTLSRPSPSVVIPSTSHSIPTTKPTWLANEGKPLWLNSEIASTEWTNGSDWTRKSSVSSELDGVFERRRVTIPIHSPMGHNGNRPIAPTYNRPLMRPDLPPLQTPYNGPDMSAMDQSLPWNKPDYRSPQSQQQPNDGPPWNGPASLHKRGFWE